MDVSAGRLVIYFSRASALNTLVREHQSRQCTSQLHACTRGRASTQAADWSTGPEQAGSMGAQAGKHGMGKQQWVEWSLRFPSSPGDSMLDALLGSPAPQGFACRTNGSRARKKVAPGSGVGTGAADCCAAARRFGSETLGVVEEFVVALWVGRR